MDIILPISNPHKLSLILEEDLDMESTIGRYGQTEYTFCLTIPVDRDIIDAIFEKGKPGESLGRKERLFI